jgi:hypothetical protein
MEFGWCIASNGLGKATPTAESAMRVFSTWQDYRVNLRVAKMTAAMTDLFLVLGV